MFKEFRHFIARGNVVDLAVGVIIGAAFGRIITSLVEGVIMPPLGLILQRVDFTNLFYVLDRSKGIPASLAEAKAKAIPVIAYGQFISDVISFLIVAFVVFLLVKQVNRIKSGFDGSAARNQFHVERLSLLRLVDLLQSEALSAVHVPAGVTMPVPCQSTTGCA